MNRKLTLLLSLMAVLIAISACAKLPESPVSWRDVSLRDVATDESFKISDFKGKVVVLETMSVWCSTCTEQQTEIAQAQDSLGDEVVFITLEIDANEHEATVLEHADRHGFGWFFAISPLELSSQLEAEFGTNFLNPSSSPILVLDVEQGAHLLRYGHKSAEELIGDIARYL